MALAQRIRANAALLDMLIRAGDPRSGILKRDLKPLVADLLRQASETEELEARAGVVLREVA